MHDSSIKVTIMASKFFKNLISFVILSAFLLGISEQQSPCDTFEVITRDEWGSMYPVGGGPLVTPVDYVFIHHTDMEECNDIESCSAAVRHIQDYHVNTNGWDDIGYNFLIGGDGRVYVGRGWDHIGAQTYGWNDRSEGFALMGDYMDKLPNDAMLTTAQNLVQCGLYLNYVASTYGLYGHRDGSCTSCPGDALYAEIQNWDHWYYLGTIQQNCQTSSDAKSLLV